MEVSSKENNYVGLLDTQIPFQYALIPEAILPRYE
jgi:hypothetical protein